MACFGLVLVPFIPKRGGGGYTIHVLFRVEDVYEMGHELGKGAFSVVRHGRHRQTGEHVSVVSAVSAVSE